MSEPAATIQCNGCNTHCRMNLLPDEGKQQIRQKQKKAVNLWMKQVSACKHDC